MSAPATPRRATRLGLVGRDLATEPHAPRRGSRSVVLIVVSAALLAGLGVVAIRNGQLRMRYELTEAMQQERDLLQQRRALTASVLALHDPDRLARLARERGFVRPTHVHELAAPGNAPR